MPPVLPDPPHIEAVQLQQIEGEQEGTRLVPPATERREDCQTPLIAAHHLAIDQAGPHLEVIHGLDHQRETRRPVVPIAG
jgi:hypothetical protein